MSEQLRLFTIPNSITLTNLVCGILAIVFLLEGHTSIVWILILIGLLSDFLDGFVARALNQSSPIGKELDSLADMITFGVLPCLLFYDLMKYFSPDSYLKYFALLIAAFAALRLAKFNIDIRQSDSFHGIPTPIMTLFTLGFYQSLKTPSHNIDWSFLHNEYLIITLIALLCLLMVIDTPMLSLKFSNWKFNGNKMRYILISVSLVFLIGLGWAAPLFILPFYVILSFVNNQSKR